MLEPDGENLIREGLGALTNREAAIALGMSPSRVDQLAQSAIRKLRQVESLR
jgi:DNA-directed RNA polymerase specialized sigma24 family protein